MKKKLFFLILLVLTVFLIYKIFSTNKINYISINSSKYSDYIKDYLKSNNRLMYYNEYDFNETSNKYKKDLRESDLLSISIVSTLDNISKEVGNYTLLIDEIRKYAKEDIILINYYSCSNKKIIDSYYKELSKKYNLIYIPICE